MTEEQAFEIAKKVIQSMRSDADSFYLVEAEIEEGNWVLLLGYLRYWDSELIDSEVGKSLELTNDDVGEPSGHWESQVIVSLAGDGQLTGDNILDLFEHPDYSITTEMEWRHWAIGDKEEEL